MSFSTRLAVLSVWRTIYWLEIWAYNDHFLILQGVKIVFKVGLALLKYCHDDLVSIMWPVSVVNQSKLLLTVCVCLFIRLNYLLKNSYMLWKTSLGMQWIRIRCYHLLIPSRFSFFQCFFYLFSLSSTYPKTHVLLFVIDYEWHATLLCFLHFINKTHFYLPNSKLLVKLNVVLSVTQKTLIYWFGWLSGK